MPGVNITQVKRAMIVHDENSGVSSVFKIESFWNVIHLTTLF
jgi:hypothetical protein